MSGVYYANISAPKQYMLHPYASVGGPWKPIIMADQNFN